MKIYVKTLLNKKRWKVCKKSFMWRWGQRVIVLAHKYLDSVDLKVTRYRFIVIIWQHIKPFKRGSFTIAWFFILVMRVEHESNHPLK